ncbi:MFS transporter [Phytoactinopolyspora halotolerans]|uniref:MFS transporter n=1 Tax=Phytoactinopolyspora halotolerans TaxID=1981512 RepID=A0A6L9S4E9_9ACTN|nr:MFS transporter [Phytoactinopolyspora halotolerans]NED99377.1 MFS transporter [Phytoactinopolyspora halotolerans]
MSPLLLYRRLFGLVGPAYVVVAFFGRLPMAMIQLGALLLVSTETGRYSAGGLTAGAVAVANAVGAPIAGMMTDRVGQRPVVLIQSLAASAGLATLVVLATSGAELGVVVVVAGFTGLCMPQVGPLARVRWPHIARGTGAGQVKLVDAAFAYEGAADEASFVLGPALVGAVAAIVHPGGALIVASALLAVFGSWFAIHPTAPPARPWLAGRSKGRRLITPELVVLAAAQLLIGMVFGATQTGTTVLATEQGNPGHAGLVHALLAVGSVVAGLSVASLPARFGYERRLLAFAAGLSVFAVPLVFVNSLAGLIPIVLVLGLAIAPYMISVAMLARQLMPLSQAGMAMTLLAGATGIGYALGSGTAGRLADVSGHRAAFAVTLTACATAFALALLARRWLAAALAGAERRLIDRDESTP